MQVLCLSLIVCSAFLVNLSVSIPTTTTTPYSDTTLNSIVPLEFPEYNQNYTFVDNSSIRENLVSHSENDTEVDDLLGKDVEEKSVTLSTITVAILIPNPSEEEEDIENKNDTEWIENGKDTEDEKFTTETIVNITNKTTSLYQEGVSLFDGHIGAILAGTFLLISVVAYVGLLLWRRFLDLKYGSREMLVNEDDFIDPDDMKHFSI